MSAAGAEYRRLPDHRAILASLSPDGAQVAWTTPTGDFDRGASTVQLDQGSPIVRWTDLADGRTRRADIADGDDSVRVTGTPWLPGDRWIVVELAVPTGATSWRTGPSVIDTRSGQQASVCGCDPARTVLDGQLEFREPADEAAGLASPEGLGARGLAAVLEQANFAARGNARLTYDGLFWLALTQQEPGISGDPDRWSLTGRDDGGRVAVTPLEPTLGRPSDVQLLAWDGAASALITVRGGDVAPGVWRVELGTADVRQVTMYSAPGQSQVVAAASDIAATGRVVKAGEPSWPWWRPERLRWYALGVGDALVSWPALLIGCLVVLLGLVVRSAARRPAAPE